MLELFVPHLPVSEFLVSVRAERAELFLFEFIKLVLRW